MVEIARKICFTLILILLLLKNLKPKWFVNFIKHIVNLLEKILSKSKGE